MVAALHSWKRHALASRKERRLLAARRRRILQLSWTRWHYAAVEVSRWRQREAVAASSLTTRRAKLCLRLWLAATERKVCWLPALTRAISHA